MQLTPATVAGGLHRPRSQANFVANHRAALPRHDAHPGAVDAVAVFNRHAWMRLREMAKLLARAFRRFELSGQLFNQSIIQHGFRLGRKRNE